ncbi:MAG: hypothetical protein N2C13_00675 [Chloroflexota bacterium]
MSIRSMVYRVILANSQAHLPPGGRALSLKGRGFGWWVGLVGWCEL